jgi:hypothetical protein
LYAFLEAQVIVDHGAAERLRAEAHRIRADYVASGDLNRTLATALWHGRAKLDRAADAGPLAQGFWAGICIETILDGLYTIHDIPLPAGSRRIEYLQDVPLTTAERSLLERYLTGSTVQRYRAAVELSTILRTRLGPADHERSINGDGGPS